MARIPVEQQILAIAFSFILLLVTIQLVRKHKLREEYALVWLGASATIFALTVFDRLVTVLAGLFAVSYAPTLILVFGLLFALVVLLSQSVTISAQADRIRDLAQSYGLLEQRVHQMETLALHAPAADDVTVSKLAASAAISGAAVAPNLTVKPAGDSFTRTAGAQTQPRLGDRAGRRDL